MTDRTISPLRQRMIEDMTTRGFTACTQRGYIAAVKNFTIFFGRSPEQAANLIEMVEPFAVIFHALAAGRNHN